MPARVPESLPLPATGRDVAQFVATRAAACIGADYSNVALFNAAGQSLRLFHGTFLEPDIADRYTDVPLTRRSQSPRRLARAKQSCFPTSTPIASSSPRYSPTPSRPASRRPHRCRCARRRQRCSVRSALRGPHRHRSTSNWRVRCTRWRSCARRPSNVLSATTPSIGSSSSCSAAWLALFRQSTGSRHRLGICPPVGPSVGGDWYEGVLLDGQRMALVVGDVTGHGVAAAADMALIRGMITALLHSGVPVADVFSEVSGVLPTARTAPRHRRARRRRPCRRDGHVRHGRPPPASPAAPRWPSPNPRHRQRSDHRPHLDPQRRRHGPLSLAPNSSCSPTDSSSVGTGRSTSASSKWRPTWVRWPTITPPMNSPTRCYMRCRDRRRRRRHRHPRRRERRPNGPVSHRRLNSQGPETPRPAPSSREVWRRVTANDERATGRADPWCGWCGGCRISHWRALGATAGHRVGPAHCRRHRRHIDRQHRGVVAASRPVDRRPRRVGLRCRTAARWGPWRGR